MGLNVNNMCQTLVDGIEKTFKNWKPKKKFNVYQQVMGKPIFIVRFMVIELNNQVNESRKTFII